MLKRKRSYLKLPPWLSPVAQPLTREPRSSNIMTPTHPGVTADSLTAALPPKITCIHYAYAAFHTSIDPASPPHATIDRAKSPAAPVAQRIVEGSFGRHPRLRAAPHACGASPCTSPWAPAGYPPWAPTWHRVQDHLVRVRARIRVRVRGTGRVRRARPPPVRRARRSPPSPMSPC